MNKYLVLMLAGMLICSSVSAQKIDADSLSGFVKALQEHVRENPSVFPLESYTGGTQSVVNGLRQVYFGYGERRYSHRFDFHPAMDAGYFPTETGNVIVETGETWEVRAPQTYLKKVYAIQKGQLVSIRLISSGYKLILKHTLKTPYHDNEGRPYYHYYTCYRHLDSRSLSYLNGVARHFTKSPEATYEDLFGKYIFEAGEQLGLVGFSPDEKAVEIPRAHIDFSLNLFGDPDKGSNIRNHSLNPLLLFPPFEYADPQSFTIGSDRLPAYTFVVDPSGIVAPGRDKDGRFVLQIHAGGWSEGDKFLVSRYFALNGLDIVVFNDSRHLASYRVDRHRKLGYSTKSYDLMDNPDRSAPHFLAPLGEQNDIFEMQVVLPKTWLENNQYDWSKNGSVSISVSSIWEGYLDSHGHAFTVPIPATEQIGD